MSAAASGEEAADGPSGDRWLSPSEMQRLLDLVVESGLGEDYLDRRKLVLGGLTPLLRAQMTRHDAPLVQLKADIAFLARLPLQAGQPPPLLDWLRHMSAVIPHRPEATALLALGAVVARRQPKDAIDLPTFRTHGVAALFVGFFTVLVLYVGSLEAIVHQRAGLFWLMALLGWATLVWGVGSLHISLVDASTVGNLSQSQASRRARVLGGALILVFLLPFLIRGRESMIPVLVRPSLLMMALVAYVTLITLSYVEIHWYQTVGRSSRNRRFRWVFEVIGLPITYGMLWGYTFFAITSFLVVMVADE